MWLNQQYNREFIIMPFIPTCVPENFTEAANHLAAALGEQADLQTWGHLPVQDANGNKYGTRNLLLPDTFIYWFTPDENGILPELRRPSWDSENIVDLELAIKAQRAVQFITADGQTLANPSIISVFIGLEDINRAVELWGLTAVIDDVE
jgi:hypothetical protein